MEIVPGIHKIDGIRIVNCYLVVHPKQMVLIDTGWPGDATKTLDYVRKIGRNPADIAYVVLTHADIDHIGCAAELKRFTGAKLAVHAGDLTILTGKQRFKAYNGFQPLNYLVSLWMRSMPFHPLEPDLVLEHGSVIAGWNIVHVPGHTAGSICLYQPGKTIIVGDALRTNSRGKPRPIRRRVSQDPALAKKSIAAIGGLDFEVLLPGHGAPILNTASQKIRRMAAHLK